MVIKLFFIPIEMYLGAALDLVPLNQIHKFARKSMWYMDCYRKV